MSESIGPRRMGLLEFVIAVSARAGSGDWSALCVPESEDVSSVAHDVAQQLEVFTNAAVHLLDAPNNADVIVRRFRAAAPGILIVNEQEPLSRSTLEGLDAARSLLVRDDAVALILRIATLKELLRSAPNLASFVESFVAMFAPETERLSDEEKKERLEALRASKGHSHADVIAMAKNGHLPQDQAYTEWLVLLGQGGLIGRA